MRITPLALLLLPALAASPARADLHITRDHGGYVTEYKAKYERIRDRNERVIIDGICNSACTLVFGIVPINKVCVTPRASLGFHQAYYDKAFTFGIKVTSAEGTSDLMSYYPKPVKDWISRNGGLTTEMKKIKNGEDLWKIVDPCPEEFLTRTMRGFRLPALPTRMAGLVPAIDVLDRFNTGRGCRAHLARRRAPAAELPVFRASRRRRDHPDRAAAGKGVEGCGGTWAEDRAEVLTGSPPGRG